MKTVILTPLSSPVIKTIAIPGSKSYTNRALLLAALAREVVVIQNPLLSDDTNAMIDCLKTLGITCEVTPDQITVIGNIFTIQDKEYVLNANLSGTTIRFLTALACIIPGKKTIRGEEGLNNRPIGDLVNALRELGADITYLEKEGYPPLHIASQTLQQKSVILHGNISSQYLSALLMIAPLIGNITIHIDGEQISKPYIAMTLRVMQDFGVTVTNTDYTSYTSSTQQYTKNTYIVEGDYSSAGYFLAIAALTHATITLDNLNPNSVQADKAFVSILEEMGNDIVYKDTAITITGKHIKPVTVDMNACPDQAQTLAVLAAFAKGKTVITGIASLRVKETERIRAIEIELLKMGIRTESTPSSLTIYGGNPKPAAIKTYGDHRMAMAFAVAGAKLSGMQIENSEVVTKTFPMFWNTLESIGIGVAYA